MGGGGGGLRDLFLGGSGTEGTGGRGACGGGGEALTGKGGDGKRDGDGGGGGGAVGFGGVVLPAGAGGPGLSKAAEESEPSVAALLSFCRRNATTSSNTYTDRRMVASVDSAVFPLMDPSHNYFSSCQPRLYYCRTRTADTACNPTCTFRSVVASEASWLLPSSRVPRD